MSTPGFIVVSAPLLPPDPDDYLAQVFADAPAAFYRFGQSSGDILDMSGNSRHGEYNRTPATLVSGPLTDDEPNAHHAVRLSHYEGTPGAQWGWLPNDLSYNLIDYNYYDSDLLYSPGDIVRKAADLNTWWIATDSTQGNDPATSPAYWNTFAPTATDYPLSLSLFSPWTLEFWFRVSSDPGAATIRVIRGHDNISAEDDPQGSAVCAWEFKTNDSSGRKVSFGYSYSGGDASVVWDVDAAGADLTDWHHFAITYSTSGTLTMYVNSDSVDTATPNKKPGAFGSVQIRTQRSSTWTGNPLAELSSLAFYDTELSAERVAAHYDAAP